MKRSPSPKRTGKGLCVFMAAAWLFLSFSPSAEAYEESPPAFPQASSTGRSPQGRECEILVAQGKPSSPGAGRGAYETPSPEEKDRLKGRSRKWEDLSPKKRQELERRMERWQQMSPEEREIIRKRHRQWQELPPGEQERIRERLDRWNSLTPQEQEEIRRKFKRP